MASRFGALVGALFGSWGRSLVRFQLTHLAEMYVSCKHSCGRSCEQGGTRGEPRRGQGMCRHGKVGCHM